MAIYAYYGDKSHLEREKHMFELLLTQLKLHWQHSEEWIYLFYNTMWNGLEIDAIAFTAHAIVVIDLKRYSGKLTGSENGSWLIEPDIEVKGGNQINPFVQIRKNKFAVMNWFQQHNLFSQQNLGFISGTIVFDELQHCQLDLSDGVKKWFWVTDIAHSCDTLANRHSQGIHLEQADIRLLIERLKLQHFEWDSMQLPRDIRFELHSPAPQYSQAAFKQAQVLHQPDIELKYSLLKQLEYGQNSAMWYLTFAITLLICLAIALKLATYIQQHSIFGLMELIF